MKFQGHVKALSLELLTYIPLKQLDAPESSSDQKFLLEWQITWVWTKTSHYKEK